MISLLGQFQLDFIKCKIFEFGLIPIFICLLDAKAKKFLWAIIKIKRPIKAKKQNDLELSNSVRSQTKQLSEPIFRQVKNWHKKFQRTQIPKNQGEYYSLMDLVAKFYIFFKEIFRKYKIMLLPLYRPFTDGKCQEFTGYRR